MDWQDDEFETLLRKFRLKETRPFPHVQAARGIRSYRLKIAAAAALVLAIGASAAIVRQLSEKKGAPVVADTIVPLPIADVSLPVAIETPAVVATVTASAPIPPVPQAKTPSIKPDPKVPEPLKQMTVIVPAPAQDAGPLSAQDSPQIAGVAEEGKGRQAFLAVCGACHSVDLIGNSHFDTPQEYAAIVDRMVSLGAPASPQEASAIVGFLFQTYGKKPVAHANDRGNTVFNTACGQCHSTDLMDGRKGADKDTYRSIVNNMIGYGAGVAPGEVDPLVEYLFKTYGKKLN